MIYKNFSRDLTSYDFLKTLALVLMVVDHLGYHFFPDESWFRVIGRLCVPIWFFLIGYARSRDIPKSWWIGGVLLIASSFIAGQNIFPLTILFTLMATRLWVDAVMVKALRTYETFAGMFFLMFFLSFPTSALFDYGSFGMLFAMFGWMVRNRDEVGLKTGPLILFVVVTVLVYGIGQGMMLPVFTGLQATFLAGGLALICGILYRFQPKTYPRRLSKALTRPVAGLFQITGRWTLEIYVAHLLLFRAAAMALYPERFGLFDWTLFPPGVAELFQKLFSFG